MCDRCTALAAFGLTRDATQAEIKDAYRVYAKVWHPDRFHDDEQLRAIAEEKLKGINSAYQLLTTTSADVTPAGTSEQSSRAEQSQPTAAAASGARPVSRPDTSHSDRPFRRSRHGNRMWVAVTFVIVFAAGAWVILRDSVASQFAAPRPANRSAQQQMPSPATDNSRQPTVGTSAVPGDADRTKNPPATTEKPAPQARKSTGPSEEPSLVVYPADDPRVPYFTIGSTRNDVIRLQGAPSAIDGDTFEYGRSVVYFKDGRVQSWHADPSTPLRARMPE